MTRHNLTLLEPEVLQHQSHIAYTVFLLMKIVLCDSKKKKTEQCSMYEENRAVALLLGWVWHRLLALAFNFYVQLFKTSLPPPPLFFTFLHFFSLLSRYKYTLAHKFLILTEDDNERFNSMIIHVQPTFYTPEHKHKNKKKHSSTSHKADKYALNDVNHQSKISLKLYIRLTKNI